jgi:hypothetical protein
MHFLQCDQNKARAPAIAALLKTILTDPHPSCPAFAACIESFLQNPHAPVNPPLLALPSHMRETFDLAIQTQTLIGWLPAFQGFLSTHWHTLAATSLSAHALLAIAIFTRTIWLGRNDALHKKTETEDSLIYSTESAEIRHYHANPNILPASDRHYCSTPLSTLIRSRPSTRRRWLQRIRTARANFIKHGSHQRSITDYVQRTERTTTTVLPTVHSHATHRAVTTQQRMTKFFPGRPPDLTTTTTPPGNPSLPT